MVEEALRRALESRLLPDDPKEKKFHPKERFFSPNGTMGSFGPKIQLGYLLGMYDKDTVRTLEGISDIRNLFAHRLSIASFGADDNKLDEGLNKLGLHTIYSWYPHPLFQGDSNIEVEAASSARERFIVNAKLLLVLLMRDLRLHLPNSNQFQPLPAAPTGAANVPETEADAVQRGGPSSTG